METNHYQSPTTALAHQLKDLEDHGTEAARARWWEQGTGKTKPTIDEAGIRFLAGEITALMVVAPKGVDFNWLNDELPKHLGVPFKALVWQSSKTGTKWFKAAALDLINHKDPKVLAVLIIGYDACKTVKAEKAVLKFLERQRTMIVADEATRIKNPDSFTTKRLIRFARRCPVRRVLNGTPVADSPFHSYSQLRFLDQDFWKRNGIATATAMRTEFGVFDKRRDSRGNQFEVLLTYRNLDRLNTLVAQVGTRYAKADVLDLPPKVYQTHYFDLTPEQNRLYRALEQDYIAWFGDGSMVTADLAIVRQTRLAQICSNYLPADDEDELRQISKKNVRLAALMDLISDHPGQAIIWGRYNIDVDLIVQALVDHGLSVCQIDGRTSAAAREIAKQGFQSGDFRFLVAKASGPAGRGLTLTAAKTVIYYNNGYSLDDRSQSEDRAHRIGQDSKVLYIDLVARRTVDEHILKILKRKCRISSEVMGDTLPEWIT